MVGMLPRALKMGTGSEQYAPLARAIIGGDDDGDPGGVSWRRLIWWCTGGGEFVHHRDTEKSKVKI